MGLDERLVWFLIGCVVGFILGRINQSLGDIKEELHDVDLTVHGEDSKKALPPPPSRPWISQLALLLVVATTVWASFASQRASNDIKETQVRIDNVTSCNRQYLDEVITALNQRTTYSSQQANANVRLQRAQTEYLRVVLIDPPASDAQTRKALQRYFVALTKFVDLSNKTVKKQKENQYPTTEELENCLKKEN